MSIRTKVLISVFTSFFVVILLLSSFLYSRFEGVIVERVKSDVKGVMHENKQSFDNVVRGIGRSFASVSSNDFLIEVLLTQSDSPSENSKNKARFVNEYRSIFELSIGSMLNKYALHFYINKEIPIAKELENVKVNSFLNEAFGVYSTKSQLDEPWLEETLKTDAPWHMFRMDENKNFIYFSKKITAQGSNSANYGEFLGVSVIGIDCHQLLNEMQMLAVTENVDIAILDEKNQVISKSSTELEDAFIEKIASENYIAFNSSDAFEASGYVINMVKSDAGITFISFVPSGSIYLQTNDIRSLVMAGIIFSLIIAFVVLLILSYYLTRPIKELSLSMTEIDYGNLKKLTNPVKSRDEVAELYKAFNLMMGKIEASIERENKQNEKARQLEIQMLQAQINPHFLYNVLDSISWLAMENKQEKIGEMADLLSQLFAYSIKDGKITAELKEELQSVKKYVTLQKNRYTENINLSFDADDECMDFIVPKCILQPIVENSIVHGLDNDTEGINIVISVRKDGEFIEICVEDDGKGCDVNKLNEILNGGEIKYHMGIKNVSRRILESYGSGFGLKYEENAKGGITAKILLKAEK